jgi:hypothetical protein
MTALIPVVWRNGLLTWRQIWSISTVPMANRQQRPSKRCKTWKYRAHRRSEKWRMVYEISECLHKLYPALLCGARPCHGLPCPALLCLTLILYHIQLSNFPIDTDLVSCMSLFLIPARPNPHNTVILTSTQHLESIPKSVTLQCHFSNSIMMYCFFCFHWHNNGGKKKPTAIKRNYPAEEDYQKLHCRRGLSP